MCWKKCKKPAVLTLVLLLAICFTGLAQTEKLAISKYQVLKDFYTNPALFGYWGKPAFGAFYEGSLKKEDLPNNDIGLFYNQGKGKYGYALELHRSQYIYNNIISIKPGISRSFDLTSNVRIGIGAAIEYTHIETQYEGFTFPDEVEPFYGFVKGTDGTNIPNRSAITADFGFSLHYKNFILSAFGENIAPIVAVTEDKDVDYFDSESFAHFPPKYRTMVLYEFNLGSEFIVSPGLVLDYYHLDPEPFTTGLINIQWRNLVMMNYSYEVHGIHQIMVGGRIKDKVSLSMGATKYMGYRYSPFYADRINFQLSVVTQL